MAHAPARAHGWRGHTRRSHHRRCTDFVVLAAAPPQAAPRRPVVRSDQTVLYRGDCLQLTGNAQQQGLALGVLCVRAAAAHSWKGVRRGAQASSLADSATPVPGAAGRRRRALRRRARKGGQDVGRRGSCRANPTGDATSERAPVGCAQITAARKAARGAAAVLPRRGTVPLLGGLTHLPSRWRCSSTLGSLDAMRCAPSHRYPEAGSTFGMVCVHCPSHRCSSAAAAMRRAGSPGPGG